MMVNSYICGMDIKSMKVSNCVKRNITFALFVLGLGCSAARTCDLIVMPASGRAWFHLCSILFLTVICLFDCVRLHRLVKRGVKFGDGC